jgi:HD-GYP domain-containing protein (c-di-GMP phosphodiesterase class II)
MNYAHQVPFYYSKLPTRELISIDIPQHPIYVFNKNRFRVLFEEGKIIPKDKLKKALSLGILEVFIHESDMDIIKDKFQFKLRKVASSLSFGPALENANKQANLMTINLSNLYRNPNNDEILTLLFQSSGNFIAFLKENKKLIPRIYMELQNHKFHFTFLQPLLSSLLLLGYAQYLHSFNDRDLENLFVSSYFKDLGMSFLPFESHNKIDLADTEKQAIHSHPSNSTILLDGRIPLTNNFLEIINNHHYHNDIVTAIKMNKKPDPKMHHLIGIETVIVSVTDMLTAMTSKRPYRENFSLFATLDLVKKVMSDQHPHEFKALVNYLRFFFSQT